MVQGSGFECFHGRVALAVTYIFGSKVNNWGLLILLFRYVGSMPTDCKGAVRGFEGIVELRRLRVRFQALFSS